MFTRLVEFQTKPEHKQKLTTTITTDVLPILRTQTGFTDLVALVPENETDKVIVLSFWNSKGDAERYMKETYPRILDTIRPLLTANPKVVNCTVENSTVHRIAAGKAA